MQEFRGIKIYRSSLVLVLGAVIAILLYAYVTRSSSYFPYGFFFDNCYGSTGAVGTLVGLPVALLLFSFLKKYYGTWLRRALFGLSTVLLFSGISSILTAAFLGESHSCDFIAGYNPSGSLEAWSRTLLAVLPPVVILIVFIREFYSRKNVSVSKTSIFAWVWLVLSLLVTILPIVLILTDSISRGSFRGIL